jgi:hypothetical protein
MTEPELANALICPGCGKNNKCGVALGQADCWCMQLPQWTPATINTAASTAVCYCPACLAELTAPGERQQGSQAQQYKPEGST